MSSQVTQGRFIVLEGIEGVGKTTHMSFIADLLQQRGQIVRLTREPGGTPIGEALREVLLDKHFTGMSSDTELLLMFAARAEHIDKIIRPAIAAGETVISDRFTDATYAYQGGGRGLDTDRIRVLESFVQQALRPDLVLLLDAGVDIALSRTRVRGAADRFESETREFFQRVRASYLARAAECPDHYVVINAEQGIDEVQEQISDALSNYMP